METNDFLTYNVNVCGPVFLVVFIMVCAPAHSCYVVGQSVDPYIYDVTGIEVYRYAPFEGCTGNTQIFQTGFQEVSDHFVLTCVGLQEFGIFFVIFDDSVAVFGQFEEVAFFFQQFYITAAVGAFAVFQLCFCEEGFTGCAVPAFVGRFVDIAFFIQRFEDFLYSCDVVVICCTDESVIGNFHQFPQVFDACYNFVCVFLGCHALAVCDSFDFLTMFVCTCQEHNVIAAQSFVTCHCVSCYCAVGMTDVQFVTGIVNGCGDIEFFFSHDKSLL